MICTCEPELRPTLLPSLMSSPRVKPPRTGVNRRDLLRPPLIDLQRHLKRLQRVRLVEFFEKELAPRRLNRGIAGRFAGRLAVRGVRLLEASERPQRAGGARDLACVGARVGQDGDAFQNRDRIGTNIEAVYRKVVHKG